MNAPKLLHWYARRAGVPTARAEALWRKAVRQATDETGWVGTPEYWGATMDNFQRLLKAERSTLCAPLVTPLLRSQKRIFCAPIDAMSDVAVMTMRRWHHYMTQGQKAA
ncbi:MAG: hypothetical protein KDG55_16805 [Rhodocyclaceae bacterium]|nr:hypothetical protein [Rhodocyclaceae bacterium]